MVMSITKSSSKIYKPKLYKEATNDLIYRQQWRKAIKKELQNLENHQMWVYNELLLGKKAIRSK